MKRIATVLIMCFGSYVLAEIPYPAAEADQKRFVMEFRSQDQKKVLGVELVIAKPGDDGRSPMELLERQVGLKWSGMDRGDVYRFDPASLKWELIMGRDLHSTETTVGGPDRAVQLGLKISELQSGDVIICRNTFAR